MNWKNEAMERLRRYDGMLLAAKNIPIELRRLEEAAVSIRRGGTDGCAVLSGGNRQEEQLLDNMMNRQELTWQLRQTESWLDTMERALMSLPREERLVLERFYIRPEKGSVERLCTELGAETSTVYRKRDKALRKFTIALYGCEES
ncbi:MAG: hypothetical protein E7453_08260 [Ruminococcaceae bacterium]|nr:hypothetical protein [Oscillospiraceae bacterium]